MGGADRGVAHSRGALPVVPEQDVQSGERAQFQRSLVFAQKGGEDGDGVRKNRPQVDFQRGAGDEGHR